MKKILFGLMIFSLGALCSCEKNTDEEQKYTLLADFGTGESDAF